jgi:hypothetical protein
MPVSIVVAPVRGDDIAAATEPDEQLDMLIQETEQPKLWPCPTCRGNRQMLRRLYPDETADGGPTTTICPCRTCNSQGAVPYDPDDHTYFPH